MRKLLPAILLLALASAGCSSNGGDDGKTATGPTPAQLAAETAAYDALEARIGYPITDDGKDADLPDHVNLERVATVTGAEGRIEAPLEGFVESAVKNGFAYICRTGVEQGLVIFDVADIEKPRAVGYLRLNAGFEADIEVSDDGNWAFWETQRAYLGVPPPTPDPMDPTGAGGVAPHGVHVIDISDKANPRWVSFTPIAPDGPHSITYAEINGRHIVFASTYSFFYVNAPNVAVPGVQRLVILELDTSLPTPALVQIAEYIDPDSAEEVMATGEKFPHDVSFQVHPITNQSIAYVAYWDLGIVMLDMADPANPVKIGQADDFGPAPYGDIHMARPFPHLIGGRHVTVSEPEISGQPDTGYMTFFDTSDPANPLYISSWKIPGNSTQGAAGGGPHYFDAAHGRLIVSHYGAGFWAVDVHDEQNLLKPRTVGYAFVQAGGGSAFDAWWADSTHVVASESGAGLVVFRYTGPNPLPDDVWLG